VGQYFRWRRHFGPTLDEFMQALKAIVIFLGVLIVIGMGVLAYGLMKKFDEWQARKDGEAASAPIVEYAPSGPAPVVTEIWTGDLRVAVPAGARVAETVVADGQMIVRLSLADDSQRYLIFDLGTGKQIGAIELRPGGGVQ
jgi:hypothetical protein